MEKDKHILGVRERLRRFQATDRNERLRSVLLRWLEDPLKPKTKNGKLRINPILVLLGAMAATSAATFLFFSLVHL